MIKSKSFLLIVIEILNLQYYSKMFCNIDKNCLSKINKNVLMPLNSKKLNLYKIIITILIEMDSYYLSQKKCVLQYLIKFTCSP